MSQITLSDDQLADLMANLAEKTAASVLAQIQTVEPTVNAGVVKTERLNSLLSPIEHKRTGERLTPASYHLKALNRLANGESHPVSVSWYHKWFKGVVKSAGYSYHTTDDRRFTIWRSRINNTAFLCDHGVRNPDGKSPPKMITFFTDVTNDKSNDADFCPSDIRKFAAVAKPIILARYTNKPVTRESASYQRPKITIG